MTNDVSGLIPLISAEEIQSRVVALAGEISRDYQDKRPILIGILKGSFIFLADLSRHLTIDHIIDFMMVASYDENPHQPGNVKLLMDLGRSISGENVVVVEDIVDSGRTLNYIYRSLLLRKPRSLEIVSLMEKGKQREVDLELKYVGFEIPPKFVVGYGLDESESYRGLPYIAYKAGKG